LRHLNARAARGWTALAFACSGLLVAQPALAASAANGNGNSAAASAHSNGKSAAAPGHNKGTSVSATPNAAKASVSNGNGASAPGNGGGQGRAVAKGNPHNAV